jgi:hypothetical protein
MSPRVRPQPLPTRAARAALLLGLGAVATATAWWWPYAGPLAGINRKAALVGALAISALLVLLPFALGARWRVLATGVTVVLWWLGVETFAAPHLVHRLKLVQYFAAKDPDHWPAANPAQTNEDALRATPPAREFGPDTLNVLFLGDSYTYGLFVQPNEAFPSLVRDALSAAHPERALRFANFGWSSSSPLLSYRRLLAIGDRYHPDVVVLCVDMTDFGDDIRWGNIIEGRGLYWWYDKTPILLRGFQALAPDSYERFVAWTVDAPSRRFFHSEAPLEETRRHMEPLAENVDRIHAWCTERGAEFVLVVLPRSYQHSTRESPRNKEAAEYEVLGPYALEPFKYVDELRDRGKYPVWSLLEAFQQTDVFPVCFDHDPHWVPAGHRVAADALIPMLEPVIEARAKVEADAGPSGK